MSPPPPAPDSWAADPGNEVAIWVMRMEDNARWTIPASSPGVDRMLYFYKGSSVRIAGVEVQYYQAVEMMAEQDVILENGDTEGYFLMLQGRPIKEPVVQHGPFVMNTQKEIQEAIQDYYKTQFGGWPWPRHDMVHGWTKRRFAKYADGRMEERG
jgi:redox-sensitive bicupin YhaK (pirin superfamily)